MAGMALMLVFAVGARGGQGGFRLGRMALASVDDQVADETFRLAVAGLRIAPAPPDPAAPGAVTFQGGPDAFEGPAVLARATLCGPAGPTRVLRLAIRRRPDGDTIVCRAGGSEAVLFTLKHRAAFAYSEDGRRWSDRWTDAPGFTAASGAEKRSRQVFVRLMSPDGRFEIVAAAPRERPPPPAFAPAPERSL